MELTTTANPRAHAAFDVPRAGRLRAIISNAHGLGVVGVAVGDAIETIEIGLGGVASRPTRRRAWETTRHLAVAAYAAGTVISVLDYARSAVRHHEGADAALFEATCKTALHANDVDIIAGVEAALKEIGAKPFFFAEPLNTVRHARACLAR